MTAAIPWTQSYETAIGEDDLIGRPDTDNRATKYIVEQSGWDPQAIAQFPGFVVVGQPGSVGDLTVGGVLTLAGAYANLEFVPPGGGITYVGIKGSQLSFTTRDGSLTGVTIHQISNTRSDLSVDRGSFAVGYGPALDATHQMAASILLIGNTSGEASAITATAQSVAAAVSILKLSSIRTLTPSKGAGSTIGEYYGLYVSGAMSFATVTEMAALRADLVTGASPINAGLHLLGISGATVNNYGILIGDVTGTGAYAIKTGLGTVEFGDVVQMRSLGIVNPQQSGAFQVGLWAQFTAPAAATSVFSNFVSTPQTPTTGTFSIIQSIVVGDVIIGGTATVDSVYALVVGPQTATANNHASIFIYGTTATASVNTGIRVAGISGGTVNNYGLVIGDVTGTGAYAIKTGAGKVEFADGLGVGIAGAANSAIGLQILRTTNPVTNVGGGQYGLLVNVKGTQVGGASSFTAGMHMQMFADTNSAGNLWALRVGQPQLSGSVNITDFRGLTIDGAVTGGIGTGTITTAYGIYINPVNVASANNYGLFIGDVTGTGAYAIYTGAGTVRFGGSLIMGTDPGGSQPIRGTALGFQSTSQIAVYGGMVISTSTLGVASNSFYVGLNVGATAVSISGTGGLSQVGNATIYGIFCNPTPSATNPPTTAFYVGYFQVVTPIATFTLAAAAGVYVADASLGTGTTLTTQYGLLIADQTKGATNYAIYTGRGLVRFGGGSVTVVSSTGGLSILNLGPSSGGALGIGTDAGVNTPLTIGGPHPSTATAANAIYISSPVNANNTSFYRVIYVQGATAAAAFTIGEVTALYIDDAAKGAGSTITTQYGLYIAAQTKGVTNWSIYVAGGTAYFGGKIFIGTTTATSDRGFVLQPTGGYVGGTQYGALIDAELSGTGVSYAMWVRQHILASTTVGQSYGVYIVDAVLGSSAAISAQYGLYIENQTKGGTNYAIYTNAGLVRFGDNVNIVSGKVLQVNATQVVSARKTGWTPWTGTAVRTTFNADTATTLNVAQALKALIDDLHATAGHGLIGT